MSAAQTAWKVPAAAGAVRVYFAPVDRTAETPSIFDAGATFDCDSAEAPWVDLGWAENFKRAAKTTLGAVRTGPSGLMQVQFRRLEEARVSVDFREWGKLQMALAGGSQHMNVLAEDGTTTAGAGGKAVASVTLATGSTASELMLAPAALSGFAVGDLVAVDVDYGSQTGYVGTGAAGAYVAAGASSTLDADYIRRVTFNVGRVTQITANSLQLETPLVGGVPANTARVQKVVAFVDREGASYFQEWSALFVMPQSSGGQVRFYYPRLQTAAAASESIEALGTDYVTPALHAEFVALPVLDAIDGEEVVCYRSYDCRG